MSTEQINSIELLISKYVVKIALKKKLNKELNNDVVEGIILSLEDVVKDLRKLI